MGQIGTATPSCYITAFKLTPPDSIAAGGAAMGNNPGNICYDFYSSYPASEYFPGVSGNVGIGGIIIGVVYFCSSAITIAWIRKQQHNALMGMEGAAKHVVFPIYLPIMWVSALSDAFLGMVIFFVKVSTTGTTIWPHAIIIAAALGIQHVVIEGIAIILMQYGCGMRAMRVAGMTGGAVGLATFLAVLFFYRDGSASNLSGIIYFCWLFLLLFFYATLWLMPQKRLYRRPAVIFYAKFWTLFEVMVILAEVVGAFGPHIVPDATMVSACVYNVVALPVFVVFKPFIMYTTLLMESKWWQGLLIRTHPAEVASTGRGSSSSRGGRKSTHHPIRYISSVDGPLDQLVGRQSDAGSQQDLSMGTRDSDIYSTESDLPKGFFAIFASMMADAFGCCLGKNKFSSVSQYSDSNNSGASNGNVNAGEYPPLDDEDAFHSGAGSSAGDEESGSGANTGDEADEDDGGEGSGAEGARKGEGAGAAEPLLGAEDRRDSTRNNASGSRRSSKRRGGARGRAKEGGAGAGGGGGLRGTLSHMRESAGRLFSRRGRNHYDQLKGPLLGVEVGFSEAQELAQEVDNITNEGTVKLLNFAYLSLDKQGKKLLGSGSFSKVYAGQYRNHPVAVKMLFTQDLNPDVIKRCSNEARILTEISPHPNVVHVFGVSVLPPSVCLVLEICEYGSLSDVLRGGDGTAGQGRSPLNLSYSDRMFLALGCARGLQALHSYSPLLCHRDIKSMNFLIDSQLNAKIADLDLGHQYEEDPNAVVPRGAGAASRDGQATADDAELGNAGRKKAASGPVNVGGSNMCIYWQAPEVLQGLPYTQRSDVHSLALVIWEIVSAGKVVKFYTKGGSRDSTAMASAAGAGGTRSSSDPHGQKGGQVNSAVSYGAVPYAECKNMQEVREKILKGYRPVIPSAIGSPGSVKSITGGLTRTPDPILLDVLQLGWHPEPHMRPDVDFMVEGLTRCWRNSLHSTILETPFLVDITKIQEENFKLTVLQDYSNKGYRGSNITMASSFLGASMTHAAAAQSDNASVASGATLGAGSVASGGLSSYSRSQAQQRVVRKPPSPEVIASLLLMKSEPCWSKLEDEGAYLVLTPLRPFYMLWATRKWTQLTGYLVNDVIAYDICTLLGPKADHFAFEECLEAVGAYGRTQHIMSTIYRRDGKPMQLSVHMFPVFDSSRDATDAYPETALQSRDSSYTGHRLSENSVAAATAAMSAQPGDQHLPGRVSFSRCQPSDMSAAAQTGAGASDGAAPANSTTVTPQRKTPAKSQPYQSVTKMQPVQSPLPAAAAASDAASGLKRTPSQSPGTALTPERKPSIRRDESGYESAGEGDRDPASILERIYSPNAAGLASAAHLSRRSTSNVYNVNSAGIVTHKVAGSVGTLTPQQQRSRAPSAAESTVADDLASHCDGLLDTAMVFESLVEDDCAHRRVAYIAVQFCAIKDTHS